MASAGAACHLLFPPNVTWPPSACPFSLARKRRPAMLCRAGRGGNDLFHLDRRDVLAGLTGVALGAYPNLAVAADSDLAVCIRGDKVTDGRLACNPSDGPPCPPPSPSRIVNFTPPSGPMRIRQPAHLADPELVEKYKLALARMKALPDSDPRSFASQAAIHQAYCDGYYRFSPDVQQVLDGDAPFDVHFSWIFAPWHRMYIYFYERILGSLIGDDTFALPYWNWDAPPGMALPEIFKDPTSPLFDFRRNPEHVNAFVVLDYVKDKNSQPIPFDPKAVQEGRYNEVVNNNLATLYNQMIRQGRGTRCFLGERYCTRYQSDSKSGTMGTLESKAHTGVHIWLGDPNSCVTGHNGQLHCNSDMGFLGTAARDPAFYSHHANVDRMWHLWATKFGGQNFSDPVWLESSFVFYDEKPQLVRIKIRDVLDANTLRYGFAEREPLLWKNFRPTSRRRSNERTSDSSSSSSSSSRGTTRARSEPSVLFPLALSEGECVVVPSVSRPRKEKGKLQVLVFDSIQFDPTEVAKFDVVINVVPEVAGGVGPQWVEYAGSFASLPRGTNKGEKKPDVKLELPVEDVLEDIGVGDDVKAIDVVLVPRTDGITINSQPRIENQTC